MRRKCATATPDHTGGQEADERWTEMAPAQTGLDGRIHRAIDLISAVIAHAEAARRWVTADGQAQSTICGLARRLVVDALRAGEQVRTPAALDETGTFSPLCQASIARLRAGADQLLVEIQDRAAVEVGLEDALRIVTIVERLETSMCPPARRTRRPPFPAMTMRAAV